MGRPVRVRVSYAADAGYLAKLLQAIEKDDRQTQEWREKTAGLARELAAQLYKATQPLPVIKKRAAASEAKRASAG